MSTSSLSLDSLFRDFRGRVYRWAFALCRRDADAVDIVQEVFLRLLRSETTLASVGAAAVWLRRATVRVAIDRWRAEKSRRAQAIALTERETIEAGRERHAAGDDDMREHAEDLRGAIGELSEQQQIVLLARTFGESTFAELARELGLSEPTVKTHYFRALAALRVRLAPAEETR